MSAAKKKTETVEETVIVPAVLETVAPAVVEPAVLDPFVIIPAKICVQIGQRKRYFDTREEALQALTDFNTKGAGRVKGASRTVLTAEQKAVRAANRAVLMQYAASEGKEGKNQAGLANVLEELIANIPAVLGLIAEYNAAKPAEAEEPAVVLAGTTEKSEAAVQAAGSVDLLAEFNL